MVKVFRCPECGSVVEVSEENIITPLSTKRIKVLLCPHPQVGAQNHVYQHIVRIKYRGKWEDPTNFLISAKEGLHEVIPKTRDEVAFYILRMELWKNGGPIVDGAYLSRYTKAKILWKDKRAIGYYSELTHKNVPIMAEIYVRPQYRGNGYATIMLKDFLSSHKGPVAFYFLNRKCMINLLLKAGAIEKNEERYKFKREIEPLDWQRGVIKDES
ncbi:hypothetical protein DRN43_02315 [Thermococci archaeon]|nr:MAG: hypothetical protein DRJ03_12590 [Chloroflexota bacterium]RLF90151.1 MAG: hypothetical protein DRN43_02315 [Thermococci archaeon]